MKIYTKTGDDGETGVLAGLRVSKNHPIIQACGEVDETNCALGMVCASCHQAEIVQILQPIQQQLFAVGCQVANSLSGQPDQIRLPAEAVQAIERQIDAISSDLPVLRDFIIPGGTRTSAELHLARAVCRRAERSLVALHRSGQVKNDLLDVIIFLNRLSDLLFVLARKGNHDSGQADVIWTEKNWTKTSK